MTTLRTRWAWTIALALSIGGSESFAQNIAELRRPIEAAIITSGGRELRGVVDARTDDRSLWLRREETGIILATAVAWDDVATATIDGDELDSSALRARAAELATASKDRFSQINSTADESMAGASPLAPTIQGETRGKRVRVQNIDVLCAALANFDRDVEPDGIELGLVARDEHGEPVAVRGSLRAELYGERRPLDEPLAQFNELDRWTEPVRREHFVDGVAVYRLPFRNTAPEWQFDLLPDAVLTVDLGAAGHGNFSASAPVVLRPFNPLRDNLQQEQGVRFLPTELERSRPLGPFGPQLGRWHHWTR